MQEDQIEGSKWDSYDKIANDPPIDKAEAVKVHREATSEEMAYKAVRKTGREPISIDLDKSESQAAKAAIG